MVYWASEQHLSLCMKITRNTSGPMFDHYLCNFLMKGAHSTMPTVKDLFEAMPASFQKDAVHGIIELFDEGGGI